MASYVAPPARICRTRSPVLRSSSLRMYSLSFRTQPNGRVAPYGLPFALRKAFTSRMRWPVSSDESCAAEPMTARVQRPYGSSY